MQSASFVALTGHLNDYPLADLVGILRWRRKTGRLLIEYSIGPCSLYFEDGNLVDAQLNSMGGLQAILIALAQPNASFNFNPLIQPPRRSINESSQKVVLELLGCPEEKTINVEAAGGSERASSAILPRATAVTSVDSGEESLPRAKEMLALPASSLEQANNRRNRRVLIASAIISLLVSLLTVATLTRWLIKRDISIALSETAANRNNAVKDRTEIAGKNVRTIKVSVRVEKGHVSQALVEEHHPGMEAYEAFAPRIARRRRYPATYSGQETVLVTISSPD